MNVGGEDTGARRRRHLGREKEGLETIANLLIRAHEKTFAYSNFSLPRENWQASFSANGFVT